MPLKFKVAIAVSAIVILTWGIIQYVSHSADEAAMQATISTLEQQNKLLKEDRAKLSEMIVAVRDDADKRIAELEKQKPKTPEQAIRIVHDVLPQAQLQQLPDAPSRLSAADAKTLADFKIEFEKLRVDVEALRKENLGLKQQADIDQKTIANITQERDVAVKTAKGGSWLRRTMRAGKYIGLGIGLGLTLSRL